jgi:hypothetical protein
MKQQTAIPSQTFEIQGDDVSGYEVTQTGIGLNLKMQFVVLGSFGTLALAERAICDSLTWQAKQSFVA